MIPILTQKQKSDFLAAFLPNGRLTTAKYLPEKILRKTIDGFSPELFRACAYFVTFITQIDPNITTDFLEEWESAIRIPDDCIPLATTDQERRDNILLKLASLSVSTAEDYINLATQFGFTITVKYDTCEIPYCIPKMIGSQEFFSNLVIMQGDYGTNPANATIFQCLVEKLIPSNSKVIFDTCSINI